MSDYINDRTKPIKERIQSLSSLPSLAVVRYHLVKAFNNTSCSLDDISEILSHDPPITSRVMAIANSAFFGHSGRIVTIEQAVMLLGFNIVRSVALASAIFSVFASQYGHLKMIWAHSYIVGSLSGLIGRKILPSDEGECFVSGLLHDIGRLALFRIAANDGIEAAVAHGLADLRGEKLLKAETAMIGCNHCEAAKWFMESLCLPDSIVSSAVNHHHNFADIGDASRISSIVRIAEGLASELYQQIESDGEWTEDHKKLLDKMGMSECDIAEIRANGQKDIASASQFMDI